MNNNYTYPNQSTDPPYENFDYGVPNNNMNIAGDADYAENILELNVGKFASFYMSYSDSLEWRDKVFSGIIAAAGKDYVVVRDTNTNHNYLLWAVYLNYVEFREDIIVR